MSKQAMAAMEAEARRNERQYKNALMKLVGEITRLIANEADPAMIVTALRTFADSKAVTEWAEASARRMVTGVLASEKRSWRMAASSSMKGRAIYAALRKELTNTPVGIAVNEIVANNSLLIKTVPRDLAAQFSEYALKMTMQGVRPEQIAVEMQRKAPQLAGYQVRRIARTESAKASSALKQARSEVIGCDWYIWHTCQDERVRGYKTNPQGGHYKMEGILCRWSDPPNPEALFPYPGGKSVGPYHPGGIYNCRCIALQVVALEDISFPCKAHIHGKIVQIGSLNELKRLAAA
ncbi:MAG: hypothetical protein IJ153_10965 [Clostridia bacterium]|nr:hypothetical protein [Clostridia bacterium]MBQ9212207.1 hypothetical protein [Clostridia bacterium]